MKRATPDSTKARRFRENVESLLVAIILALLVRSFLAEAFVIPTGSMAPTLMGRHYEVKCDQCGLWYRTGASIENDTDVGARGQVLGTVCPVCRFPKQFDKRDANQRSFNGDRILVSKVAYELSRPKRWDVLVFKFPGNAKQNYIKRLVGLPHETLVIRHGDVYVRKDVPTQSELSSSLHIVRKPPQKIKAMLQLVDDTRYLPRILIDAGWPLRWQNDGNRPHGWSTPDRGSTYVNDGTSETDSWLGYRHIVPTSRDWHYVLAGGSFHEPTSLRASHDLPADQTPPGPRAITDFYAYNDAISNVRYLRDPYGLRSLGRHWVGDLVVECDLQLETLGQGEITLLLVEGGTTYECRISVTDGRAVLAIDNGHQVFATDDGSPFVHPAATTSVRSGGRYKIRFANVDDQLHLWVDERPIQFDGPTTFRSPDNQRPFWSQDDPGDTVPVRIATRGAGLTLHRLRVLRDIYYVATDTPESTSDYDAPEGYGETDLTIQQTLGDPSRWTATSLFDWRRTVTFHLGADQYFPMGDNSPQSRDARVWGDPPFVQRELLIGEAFFVYWPHAWRWPTPWLPNVPRMRFIH